MIQICIALLCELSVLLTEISPQLQVPFAQKWVLNIYCQCAEIARFLCWVYGQMKRHSMCLRPWNFVFQHYVPLASNALWVSTYYKGSKEGEFL